MNRNHILTALTIAAFTASGAAMAGGFEKSVMSSARYTGIAGAAASSVMGTEALYFNPAGIVHQEGLGATINFDPTFSSFEAPVTTANSTLESTTAFSPIFSAFADYGITDKFGIGIGVYTPAGTNTKYEDVEVGAASQGTVEAKLGVVEASLGAAYEVVPGLKLGVAWRSAFVSADLRRISGAGASAVQVNFTDLSASEFNGFRAGLQYVNEPKTWGLGLAYRSKIDFDAEGKLSATSLQSGADIPGTGTTSTLSATFPEQVDIGTHAKISKSLTAYLQYTFTRYARNRELGIDATVATLPVANQKLNWLNQHNLRVAGAYECESGWEYRAGYVYTTKVVSENRAVPTFSTPGPGHTIVLGAGKTPMEAGKLGYDLALEYSFASADLTAADTGATALPGEYSSMAYAAHIGATYHF